MGMAINLNINHFVALSSLLIVGKIENLMIMYDSHNLQAMTYTWHYQRIRMHYISNEIIGEKKTVLLPLHNSLLEAVYCLVTIVYIASLTFGTRRQRRINSSKFDLLLAIREFVKQRS